ncbi:hypothetical protein D3C84_1150360 [compost metagenome]
MAAEIAAAGVVVLAGAGGGGGAVSAVSCLAENRSDFAQYSAGAVRLPVGFDGRAIGVDAGRGAPGAEPDGDVFQSAAGDNCTDRGGGAA